MDVLSSTLPNQVTDTVRSIQGTGQRALALRSYLRAGDALGARWSWSESQITDYEASVESQTLNTELARIIRRFEASNPGYTLYANTQVRSLDAQLQLWNDNASVRSAAGSLERDIGRRWRKLSCRPQSADNAALVEFLTAWRPPTPVPVAAPGLSKHGQARAFDFQIERDGKVIAGIDTRFSSRDWDRPGWTAKLRDAVTAASPKFSGPLLLPYEPWHYEYTP